MTVLVWKTQKSTINRPIIGKKSRPDGENKRQDEECPRPKKANVSSQRNGIDKQKER